MLSYGDLELPELLASQFTEWLRRHDLHGRKPGFDARTFDAMGAALARSLQELPGRSSKVHYRSPTSPSILGWIRARFHRNR